MISCTIDIRVPVTLKSDEVRRMCESRLEDENGRIEILGIGDALFFPRESPLVNALYKAYTDVTGDTENKPMVIGGGTYAKSLKNIIAFGPEKPGIDYRIHSADEFYSRIRYGRGSSGLYGSNQESSGNLMKNDRAVIKWRAEHEGSSIFPWYRVSL